MDLDRVKKLLDQIADTDVEEFHLERDGVRVGLRRQPRPAAPPASAAAAGPQTAPPSPAEKDPYAYILSPMVGIFYASLTPESPPLVQAGSPVSVGQRVCVVESMRIMNEVVSRAKGRVVKVLAENGRPVEYGQRLFAVEAEPPPGGKT